MTNTKTRLPMAAKALMVAALVLALSACSERSTAAASRFKSTDISAAEWGRDFHLLDHHGNSRSIADFKGKVVLLFFGYTHCPDLCPTTMADMARAVVGLGPDGARVQGLFATLDPQRDTPQLLAKYVTAFHPSFLGLHGDEARTAALAREFKFFHGTEPGHAHDDYAVTHGGSVYVYDPQGRLRLLMGTGWAVDTMLADVRLLLRE